VSGPLELSRAVRKRRMVREFAPTPVPSGTLRRVLASGLHAPSAGFAQGLELVVLNDGERLDRFWRLTDPWRRRAAGAPPVVVIVFSDKGAYLRRYSEPDKRGLGLDVEEGWPVPYWDLDAAMATMVMLLTAVDEGLGGWFFGIFHGERELVEWLGAPPGCRPIGVVALGYPAPGEGPRGSSTTRPRRRLDDALHIGGWRRGGAA
jgi:nitroreductase